MSEDCIIPVDAKIEDGVALGPRVILAGEGIVVGSGARLDAGCVIAEQVSIGRGAWVRAGAVVLSSVPPNAIVEGNPARVVGYASNGGPKLGSSPTVVDARAYDQLERPAKVPLEVGDCALYLMRRVVDARGALTVGEVPKELPFLPARYFAVFDVPSAELRGEHAHKLCKQFLVCLHGSCRVLLDDGERRCEVTLNKPDIGVYMPELIWGTQYMYSRDAVLLVFASRGYEAEDYIREYDDFVSEIKRRRS